jgi:hypothetical protein
LAYLGTILISSLLIYISRERSALFVFLLTLFLSLFLIERNQTIVHLKNEDGKYTAPPGGNDDAVMADMLAIWAHFTGKCPLIRKLNTDIPSSDPVVMAWASIEKGIKKASRSDVGKSKYPFRIRNYL